jgi:hypothetical protein
LYRIEKGNEMQNTTPTDNPWDETQEAAPSKAVKSNKSKKVEAAIVVPSAPVGSNIGDYDIDGLMTDFPTATALERFVYDETGAVLNLKGRANKLKYQVAMDVLNGLQVDAKFTSR